MKLPKKGIVIILVLALIGGGYWYYRSTQSQNTVTYKTAKATKGTLTATVSGSGNTIVTKSANVNPSISGEVSDLAVKVGDTVTKGQTLFTIINADLDLDVSKAYASLLQSKQSLSDSQDQLTSAKNDQTVTVAKAYANLLQSQQSLTDSENQLTSAEDAVTTLNNNANATDDQKLAASQKVTSATTAVSIAKINLQSAQSDYDSSKETTDQKIASATTAITVAKVNLESAQAAYDDAKKTAAKRTVTAPIDGVITTLTISNGDTLGSSSSSASSGSTSGSSSTASTSTSSSSSSVPIVINDLTSLVASVSLNEVDASSVKVGQSVSMTFDAIDSLTLTGKVESVGTVGTESSGVVTYPVTVSFDSLDSRVKPQMSVTTLITTDIKQDVVMVPNSAIKTSGDTSYVQIMKNGTPTKQTVTVGIANDSYTEITKGVSEGDTVVTQTITAATTSSTSSSKSSTSTLNSIVGGSSGQGGPPAGGGPGGM